VGNGVVYNVIWVNNFGLQILLSKPFVDTTCNGLYICCTIKDEQQVCHEYLF